MSARSRDRRVYLGSHPVLFALLAATRRRHTVRLGGTILVHDRDAYVAALTRIPLDRTAEGTTGGAAGRLTGADLGPALAAAHLPGGAELADALAAEVVEHAERWAAQDALRDDVEALGRPVVELPLITGQLDVGCLFELAARLEEHLVTEAAA